MQLSYSPEELLASHDYAAPHLVAGHRLHGGFDREGHYLSPRTLHRPGAVEDWASALRERGGEPLEIGLDLLSGPRYPNYAQHKLLLESGLGETLWSSLTNIGRTEARGAMISSLTPPPFEGIVGGELRETTLGHLGPLFQAHGIDEGGIPAQGIGGHDEMWFVVRDLAFGEGRYPLPPEPERAIPQAGVAERWMPDLPAPHAQLLRFLMGLLMIEIRAFIGFQQNEELLRDPELFQERREQADQAADIVARIRADERVHVAYLCNVFGELRNAEIRCTDGSCKPGAEIIDPAWERQVHTSKVVLPKEQRDAMRPVLHDRIRKHARGDELLVEFEALCDEGAAKARAAKARAEADA